MQVIGPRSVGMWLANQKYVPAASVRAFAVAALRVLSLAGAALAEATPAGSAHAVSADSAANPPREVLQWLSHAGPSGLRRFLSTGSDLGEVQSRVASYRIAAEIRAARAQRGAENNDHSESHFETAAAQGSVTTRVASLLERPVLLRALLRGAWRDEPSRVQGANDRVALGAIYLPTARSYLGLGLALERSAAELHFVDGDSKGFAVGPRLDAGYVVNRHLAVAVRAERTWLEGHLEIAPGPSAAVTRDLSTRRTFLKAAVVGRLDAAPLPGGGRLRPHLALHSVDYRVGRETDSAGRSVSGPFGEESHLRLLQAGAHYGYSIAPSGRWRHWVELLYDYEFSTDMAAPVDDRHTVTAGTGIAWAPAPGRRVHLEYRRYQGWNDRRSRDSLTLVLLFDL